MNGVFSGLLLLGVIYAAATGQTEAAQRALLGGAGEAVSLCVSLAGAYAFFGGLMGLLRESGAADRLAAVLRRGLMRLFRFRMGEEAAMPDICLNLASNMLGMGSAATPAGLRAMRTMAGAGHTDVASPAMTLFLVLNTTGVQLLPTAMIALRAQMGAAHPADIVLPTLISTGVSTLCGVLLCRMWRGAGGGGTL